MEKNKGPWQRNTIMMIFSGREDEHKRRHKNGQTRISLDIYGKIKNKKSTHSLLRAWSCL